MAEVFVQILAILLDTFGPALVRREIDAWEAARAASNAAFRQKYGEEP